MANENLEQNTQQDTNTIDVQQNIQQNTSAQNTNQLTTADGTDVGIARDSALQADAISPNGDAEIQFEDGNWNELYTLTDNVNTKISIVKNTIIPLIEVALIELLGNNKAYRGKTFNSVFNINNNVPTLTCSVIYSVENWIGTDIKQEDIMHDARYVLDKIKVIPNVNWNTCEIDCTDGLLTVEFVI